MTWTPLSFASHQKFPGVLAIDENDSHVFKFGHNADVGSVEEPVWDVGGAYTFRTEGSILTVSSDDPNDTEFGTGTRTVRIRGLNEDWIFTEEEITLQGLTPVNTVNEYIRINCLQSFLVGSSGVNEGNVFVGSGTVTAGVPAQKDIRMTIGEGRCLHCIWTVPLGKTFWLHDIVMSSYGNQNVVITGRIRVRQHGLSLQTYEKWLVTRGDINSVRHLMVPFPEKTDIYMSAQSSGADVDVTAVMEGVITVD